MSYSYIDCKKMDDIGVEVSVVDVYDIASEIGKEFERIIDSNGVELVSKVLPKVISALENLESLALKNERENNIIQELTTKITKLEMEKIEKAEDRQRFEIELEQIEEHWRQESKELLAMVTKLQDDNRKLIAAAEKRPNEVVCESASADADVDTAIMQRLRTMVDKQREQIRAKDKELSVKISEVDTLTCQVDRLTTIGKELRRKYKVTQGQVRTLIDERAEFLAEIQDKQRNIAVLKQRLGDAEKENEDLSFHCLEVPDLKNKAIFDLDDPNRPRFTTNELKDILQERNDLKARVSDLEDELQSLRPNKQETIECVSNSDERVPSRWAADTGKPPPASTPVHTTFAASAFPLAAMDAFFRFQPYFSYTAPQLDEPTGEEDEDAPVQGPLPYEPDDAPWKKSESGIRKFFRKLFSETNVSLAGQGPRRSLSSLSKMALSATTSTSDTCV